LLHFVRNDTVNSTVEFRVKIVAQTVSLRIHSRKTSLNLPQTDSLRHAFKMRSRLKERGNHSSHQFYGRGCTLCSGIFARAGAGGVSTGGPRYGMYDGIVAPGINFACSVSVTSTP